eukprot:COSAG03_NODE_3758_length_1843_cov_9.004014_2_plen_73_part_00
MKESVLHRRGLACPTPTRQAVGQLLANCVRRTIDSTHCPLLLVVAGRVIPGVICMSSVSKSRDANRRRVSKA